MPMSSTRTTHSWDVFLCHSSADKARVERLADALTGRGVRVWFDLTSIKGSSSIPLKIEEGLEASRTVVLCLSPAFLDSEWTAYERASILYADPTNLRQSFLLLELKACELPRGLAHFRRLDFKRYSERKVDEIVEALELEPSPTSVEPSRVSKLLSEAKACERRGDYAAALVGARAALAAALEDETTAPDSVRELARARMACSHALLLMERSPEEAWELADLAADPEALEGYPELMFSALIGKTEAAIETGRIEVAKGAAVAAQELAHDDGDERVVLQVRGRLALISGALDEAADLYEKAGQSFLAQLNREPDSDAKRQAKLGVGVCLSNKANALRTGGDIVGATTAVAKAADWFAQAPSPIDESASRRYLARCHFDTGAWEAGFEDLERAQSLAEGADFSPGVVACLELRARALATTGKPDLARLALLQALAAVDHSDDDASRRFHQMLATLAEDAGSQDEARRHLERARLLAARSGDPLKIADVAQQLERLGETNGDRGPAPQEVVAALVRKLQETESPAQAAMTMQQLGGAHRSHGDYFKAREWYKRAHDASIAIGDHALAASALIGMAEVAIVRDEDRLARDLLQEALDLVDSMPAWEVHASGQYFLGRLHARSGELHDARRILREARVIASDHHLDELKLEIDDYLEDIDDALSLYVAPSLDLSELSDEIAKLEHWYPEARRKLRRFWWYQRGDEVLRNLRSHSGAKALIVSENSTEIAQLAKDLGALFDFTAFATEERFVVNDGGTLEFVPVPGEMVVPFMNVIAFATERKGHAATE